MLKSKDSSLQKLVIGARVFYPSHGVAAVTGMEERELGQGKQIFYALTLDRGVKVLLPIGKVDPARLRPLVSAAKARQLLKRVKERTAGIKGETRTDHAARKERAGAYSEALRSGSADRYTDVLVELLSRSQSDTLSQSEQQTLDTARSYFVGEICAALDLPPGEVEADLLAVAT